MLAYYLFQSLMAIGQLGAGLRFRLENEQWMRYRVIADDVSRRRDGARDVGPLANITSDHEERRRHVVLRQHVEQVKRVRIVRPIIIGERNLLASTRAAGKCSPEPLSSRRHRLVARR